MKEPSEPSISVIVPVLNDSTCLSHLCERLRTFPAIEEIVVADGGSTDDLESVVSRYDLILVSGPTGRGSQMNEGARAAKGEALWFLHADTLPEAQATVEMAKSLSERSVVGGAFLFRLAEPRWYGPLLNLSIRIRSNVFGLPYGDQGFFVRREVFDRIGGYANIPIMEDVDFVHRIREEGRFVTLNTPIQISPRRWDREGFLKRTLLNWILMIRWKLGVPPEELVRFYESNHSVPRSLSDPLD